MPDVYKRIVAVGAGVALIGALTACGSSGPDDSKSRAATNAAALPGGGLALTKSDKPVKITWASDGGKSTQTQQKLIEEPFTEATGHTFTNISPAAEPKIKAMVSARRPIWDVAAVSNTFVNSNCDKLFEKIDTSLYEDLDKYPAGSVTPCMVPSYKFAKVFSYNTDTFAGNPPTSIKDFFDTQKYPGKRLVLDSAASGLYEAALVASGVDPKHLYPLDIDRAQQEMDKIKGNLILAPTLGTAQQALTSGQAVMTIMVSARTVASVEGGAHLAPVWDFTGYDVGGFAVLKDAQHEEEAQQLVAFASTKPISTAYAAANGFAPVRPDIKPSEISYTGAQKQFNAFDTGHGTVTLRDPTWYAENYNKLATSYTKWKVG